MDIFVIGQGEKSAKPDLVLISATIFAQVTCNIEPEKRYGLDLTEEEERCKILVTERGIDKAALFMENIVDKMSIPRDSVTTDRFHIASNQIDISENQRERRYVFDNCTYSQHFTFEFDYDKTRLAKLLELFAQNASFANCNIGFGLKKETCKTFVDDVIKAAYKNAYSQALSIAKAAGLERVVCSAASHESFANGHLVSVSRYNSCEVMEERCFKSSKGIAEKFVDVFNPADIKIDKTIYYHFKGKGSY